FQAAGRFGRLGYELVERRGLKRFGARIYGAFGNYLMSWTSYVQEGRDLMRRAIDAACRVGDFYNAAEVYCNLAKNLLLTGAPLAEVQRDIEHSLAFAQRMRYGLVVDIMSADLGFVRTMRGSTSRFGSFDDAQFDEALAERRFAENPDLVNVEWVYWQRKHQA